MSLNNIKLPEFIIEEWFKDNLIIPTPHSNYGEFAAVTPGSPKTTPPPSAAPLFSPKTTPPTPPKTASPPSALTAQISIPSSAKTPTAQAPIKSLGSNRSHITILVNTPGSPFLPDNQLAFLTKILEACRLTLADVAIVNNASTETNITTVKEQLAPKTVLLFGSEPSALRLPINFPPFKPLAYDGCTYLSSPGLDQLVSNTEESKLLKSKLWICLQTIFDV